MKLINILQEIEIKPIVPLIKGKLYIIFPETNNFIVRYIGKDNDKNMFKEHDPKHKNDPTYDETYGVNYTATDDVVIDMLRRKTIIPYNG